ncbi:cytochrome c [Sphingomonas sp. ABOLG]|uniref:cytochrome c n=1 Tax=Sphingomonas sp. ABOLG TaxID=1985880 RepID=UPI001F49872B|nr:cytochrome c [Sphingomonas sp. ABOLG]
MKRLHLLCCTLLLAACQKLPPAEIAQASAPSTGQIFAQASCGSCHAIGRAGMSSNSMAPPFPELVNKEGLTRETLTFWLRGAHNYPIEMDFSLKEEEVDDLVTYMLTLRDPDYMPPPS